MMRNAAIFSWDFLKCWALAGKFKFETDMCRQRTNIRASYCMAILTVQFCTCSKREVLGALFLSELMDGSK
jgi:hypothetical protein